MAVQTKKNKLCYLIFVLKENKVLFITWCVIWHIPEGA